MFKKLRIKIIVAVMSALLILFSGTLGVIYGSSYYEILADNQKMLERYARDYSLTEQSSDNKPSDMELNSDGYKPVLSEVPPPDDDVHKFEISTFYSVALSDENEVLKIKNDSGGLYTDDTLEKYALEIVDSKKIKGAKDNLAFLCSKKDGYTLVLFIDNTVMRSGMAMLFRNTLVFGSIFIVVIFLAAVFLAKKIVAPLEESYQKQRQFISDAGHELKTPVAVVSASTELLEREIGTNQWLSNIQYENQRMSVLIKQLLELARTENVKPQLEHLDFSRLVAGEMLPFESVAYERGLQLESDIAQNLYVEGNSSQLRQLVSILLDNAIEHSENRNVVRLTLHTEHNFASLFVINDGKEIPAEMQKQIFERFYRADKARSMDNGHFGLGLAIAKSIVVSHHGKINVSCYDGKVKFTVLLPLKK